MPLPKRSIAVLRYSANAAGYATGFFVNTKNYGRVCVTAAHVFRRDRHPGPDRSHILVNGKPAKLILDAFEEHGIDVALVTIPSELDPQTLHFHTTGVTQRGDYAFYAHAWSAPKSQPSRVTFTKIWGIRFGPDEMLDNEADPEKALPVKQWTLRSDVAKRATLYEPAIFQPGWSGAPVFNVHANASEDRVIGVLSSHAGDREATAVSVESLDFLEPREIQNEEVLPTRLNATPAAGRGGTAEVAALRFEEILEQSISPKIVEPPSLYDDPK